ncbi:MAG: hypothetical protein L3J83_08775 [Proteobacteria bacterium]|nr:hypothetical protein [Pseudomonadota bacterium]
MKYTIDDLQVVRFIPLVRKSPKMFLKELGSKGSLYLISEVLKTMIDSIYGSNSLNILIKQPHYGGIIIKYDGKGMPIKMEQTNGITNPLIYSSMLNVFRGELKKDDIIKYGHLYGIGAIINALSKELTIVTLENKSQHSVSFYKGGVISLLHKEDLDYDHNQIYIDFDESIMGKCDVSHKELKCLIAKLKLEYDVNIEIDK